MCCDADALSSLFGGQAIYKKEGNVDWDSIMVSVFDDHLASSSVGLGDLSSVISSQVSIVGVS